MPENIFCKDLLYRVHHQIKEKGLTNGIEHADSQENIIYLRLKSHRNKAIALKAYPTLDDDYTLIYAEAIPAGKIGDEDGLWIREISPENNAAYHETCVLFAPRNGYGPLFKDLFVWWRDADRVVEELLKTGMGITSPETSQS